MGTCLAIREPVLIEADEHFLARNVALTCCGAPILDSSGQLVGALNISGHLRLSAAPTLALVRLAVQNIENRALLAQHRRQHLLRFHPHREFISSAGEGILAIAADGRIVGANLAALEWLGMPSHAALCGQPVEQVFGLELSRLEMLHADTASAQALPQRDRGSLCFGIVQPPRAADQAFGRLHRCFRPGQYVATRRCAGAGGAPGAARGAGCVPLEREPCGHAAASEPPHAAQEAQGARHAAPVGWMATAAPTASAGGICVNPGAQFWTPPLTSNINYERTGFCAMTRHHPCRRPLVD